jgi:hypothetical protein
MQRAQKKPTSSLDAYDYFLRALAACHLLTPIADPMSASEKPPTLPTVACAASDESKTMLLPLPRIGNSYCT